MESGTYITVRSIRSILAAAFDDEDFVESRQGVKTIEIIGASFIADEPIIFGKENNDYIRRELDWYKSKSLNVYDIEEPVPKVWKDVADTNGMINSNYGWCVFSKENGSQYDNVLLELMRNPTSRRGQMIYTRPSMHIDWNSNGMSDFMCCSNTMHFIRDNMLFSIVCFRSQDVVFGYKNDYAWMKYVHDKLAHDLVIEPGPIYWNVGSLHVYEQHFKYIEEHINTCDED